MTGCVECLAADGWWLHLRRCAACGHIGCCDSSPSQHASKHAKADSHAIVRSFEPGEDWFWDYTTDQYYDGPELAAPEHHPLDQPTPGPAGACPAGLAEPPALNEQAAAGPARRRPSLSIARDPYCAGRGERPHRGRWPDTMGGIPCPLSPSVI